MVGEIGFDRGTFLQVLRWWEIKAIIDGYRKRERNFLIMTRWATYMHMSTGLANLHEAGIYQPEDLLRFSWEKKVDRDNTITEEEKQAIRERLREENKKNGVG